MCSTSVGVCTRVFRSVALNLTYLVWSTQRIGGKYAQCSMTIKLPSAIFRDGAEKSKPVGLKRVKRAFPPSLQSSFRLSDSLVQKKTHPACRIGYPWSYLYLAAEKRERTLCFSRGAALNFLVVVYVLTAGKIFRARERRTVRATAITWQEYRTDKPW